MRDHIVTPNKIRRVCGPGRVRPWRAPEARELKVPSSTSRAADLTERAGQISRKKFRASFPEQFPERNLQTKFPDEISGEFPRRNFGRIFQRNFPEAISGRAFRTKFRANFPNENSGEFSGQISRKKFPDEFSGRNFGRIFRTNFPEISPPNLSPRGRRIKFEFVRAFPLFQV